MEQYISYLYRLQENLWLKREVLCKILTEVGIHIKLFRLMKICLTETYSKALVTEHLPNAFPIQNGLK